MSRLGHASTACFDSISAVRVDRGLHRGLDRVGVAVVDRRADEADHRNGGEREGDGDVGAVRGAQFARELRKRSNNDVVPLAHGSLPCLTQAVASYFGSQT